MKALHKKRLLKLAEHLEIGELGHQRFNFLIMDSGDGIPCERHGCGSAGCAMGELPVVFPRHFRYVKAYIYSSTTTMFGKTNDAYRLEYDIDSFFGINSEIRHHLFYPMWQLPCKFGGKMLPGSATRKQVAANIRAFVKKMEA